MENNLFSVIITTHNSSHYIDRTIKSVIKQNFKNYEIILVDDCSDDRTIDLVKKNYSNIIKIFSTKKNFGGPAKSRNIGIQNSNGIWISFLDGDDYWFQDRLKHFNNLISTNQTYDIFCSNELLFNNSDKKKIKIYHGPSSEFFFQDLLINGNKLSPSSTIVKREFLLNKNVFFDEDRNLIGVEDYDFWLNLAKNNAKFFFTNKILNIYVIHEKNITNNAKKHMENTINVINKYFKFLKTYDPKDRFIRIFNIKVSFYINQIIRKKNLFHNLFNIVMIITINPYKFFLFLLNKIK